MADIFLSYARADAEKADQIRSALEALGLTVFFDTVNLDAGDVFPERLEAEIETAGVVLSCWTTHALTREWVLKECNLARAQNKLVPVEIGDIDEEVMTVAYSKIDRRDLRTFDGDASNEQWRRLIRTLERRLGKSDLLKLAEKRAQDAQKAAERREKERARLVKLERRTKELEQRKRGLRTWQWGVVALFFMVVAGGAALYGRAFGVKTGADMATAKLRDSILSVEMQERLAKLDSEELPKVRAVLQDMLVEVSVYELMEVSTVGDVQASLLVAWAFRLGEGGLIQDSSEAVRYFERACEGGFFNGCTELGYMYDRGEGVEQDFEKAARLYEKSCKGGNLRGCNNFGFSLLTSQGVEPDFEEGIRLLQLACAGDDWLACNNLGAQYINGDAVQPDHQEAERFFRRACDAGESSACLNLGYDFAEGNGFAPDFVKATSYFQMACDLGDAQACADLGSQYTDGRGVQRDFGRASQYFQLGCDGGFMPGCTLLGELYANGQGVDPDISIARDYYLKACQGDDVMGCRFLGESLASDQAPDPDIERARGFFQRACDQGDQWSCDWLRNKPD